MHDVDPRRDPLPTSADMTKPTTGHLIAGAKVSGTAVYDMDGQSVGKIVDVMLNKATGRVAYAVLSFGGLLGLGSKHFPLPWDMLHYDTTLGGFVVKIDKKRLESAPRVEDGWSDRHDIVDQYWGLQPG